MRILIEEHQYDVVCVKDILHGIDADVNGQEMALVSGNVPVYL